MNWSTCVYRVKQKNMLSNTVTVKRRPTGNSYRECIKLSAIVSSYQRLLSLYIEDVTEAYSELSWDHSIDQWRSTYNMDWYIIAASCPTAAERYQSMNALAAAAALDWLTDKMEQQIGQLPLHIALCPVSVCRVDRQSSRQYQQEITPAWVVDWLKDSIQQALCLRRRMNSNKATKSIVFVRLSAVRGRPHCQT